MKTPPKKRAPPKRIGQGRKIDQQPVRSSGDAAPDADSRVKVDAATRYNLIARAAYLRAEKRGFAPGGETQDWLEAEAEIERLLRP